MLLVWKTTRSATQTKSKCAKKFQIIEIEFYLSELMRAERDRRAPGTDLH